MEDVYTSMFGGPTPQSQKALGKDQVENNAGGMVFQLDKFDHLRRFLILGSSGGTYYEGGFNLTRVNTENILDCIQWNPMRVLSELHEVNDSNSAIKHDTILFTFAMLSTYASKDYLVSRNLISAAKKFIRTGYHLFRFVEIALTMRRWGPNLRKIVSQWYLDQPTDRLLYQINKYPSRNGWSHADLIRLSHVKPRFLDQKLIFKSVVSRHEAVRPSDLYDDKVRQRFSWYHKFRDLSRDPVKAHMAGNSESARTLLQHINEVDPGAASWEMLPSYTLGKEHGVKTWSELLPTLPATALVRNLGRMTSIGVLKTFSEGALLAEEKLSDQQYIQRSRLHPLALMSALRTYKSGAGVKGKLSWTPSPEIIRGLEAAIENSFGDLPEISKRVYIGIDCSGSMTWEDLASLPGINPRIAAGVLSLMYMKQMKHTYCRGFTVGGTFVNYDWRNKLYMQDLDINRNTTPSAAMSAAEVAMGGGTDVSLPMQDALHQRLPVDAFIIITDNETWHGHIHPFEALKLYREEMGIRAKLIVVGMTATAFTIADPDDPDQLDIVGFDLAAAKLLNKFIEG